MAEELKAMIIDSGTSTTKCGWSGDDAPKSAFASIVGRPAEPGLAAGMKDEDVFLGDEAQNRLGLLQRSSPIRRGLVTNWDDMERIWHHTFYNELATDPSGYPILLTEVPLNPKTNRERMAQIMFETFHAAAVYIASPAVLSLYANGKTTGIVLDCGEEISHAVPVYDGYAMPHAVTLIVLGGADLTMFLRKTLSDKGYSFSSAAEIDIARAIKETVCTVSTDFDSDYQAATQSTDRDKTFEGSDNNYTIGVEQYLCPEVLFKPCFVDKECPGVHEAISNSIQKCDVDIRKELWKNVVLAGGSTKFEGFVDRVQKELKLVAPTTIEVEVVAPENRKFSAWVGGSVLAGLAEFQGRWITKNDYEDEGPSVVHSKCR